MIDDIEARRALRIIDAANIDELDEFRARIIAQELHHAHDLRGDHIDIELADTRPRGRSRHLTERPEVTAEIRQFFDRRLCHERPLTLPSPRQAGRGNNSSHRVIVPSRRIFRWS